jgi:hypothetical protein
MPRVRAALVLMAELVRSGLVATSGAKGAKLIDPVELKPLIEAVPCSACGELAPLGRAEHADCKRRTKEARERARQNISRWWASPDAEAFRERIAELPCPPRGNPVRLPEPTLRARTKRNQMPGIKRAQTPKVFCDKSCAASYRWEKGIGLQQVAGGLPPRARQTVFGRWHGHEGADAGIRGAPAGIEASKTKPGRPRLTTPSQQQEILRLDKEGLSSREIAVQVFGNARYKDRVLRHLRS